MFNAFTKAVTIGKLEKNPCIGVNIKSKKSKKKSTLEYLKSEDIPLFLQHAYKYNYVYYIFFRVLIETGMRKGEAAALQWNDINLKEKYIEINKTLDFQPKEGEERFGDPKTYESYGKISISDTLAKELHKHVKWQNENKLALKEMYKHEYNLVFCKHDGDFLPKSTLFNAMNRILDKANLDRIPIHGLRHTHAVLLMESGADMKYIQERLRHKSIVVTADTYSHISEKLDLDRMKNYNDYISTIIQQES